MKNIKNFILLPGVPKTDFFDFSDCFTKQKSGNPGISSETTRESRVRRPGDPRGVKLDPWVGAARDLGLGPWLRFHRFHFRFSFRRFGS